MRVELKPSHCLLLWFGVVCAESNPSLAPWGDALFYSTIGTLYKAAQLDAVATVAEAWADTAIRLALYISPVVRTGYLWGLALGLWFKAGP